MKTRKFTACFTVVFILISLLIFPQIATASSTWDFGYTGGYQKFTAPVSGNYQLEVWGAQGGSNSSYTGGLGGYSVGGIYLSANQTIYIYVGSQSGWNGGGLGATNGGGASDIRTVAGDWNDGTSLHSRLIVAGGGGGASGYLYDDGYGNGGAGGGTQGNPGYEPNSNNSGAMFGQGGTQTSGGSGYISALNGGFGQGGNSSSNHDNDSSWYYNPAPYTYLAGGGGGGWYGGSGGYYDHHSYHHGDGEVTYICPGGGGSGYTGGVYNGSMQAGVQPGNGYARITKVSNVPYTDVETWGYGYNGNYQTFTVPYSGTYKIETWGAQGGNYSQSGGLGGYSEGTKWLNQGDKLYIYVGGQGSTPNKTQNYWLPYAMNPTALYVTSGGGYNGGGDTAAYVNGYNFANGWDGAGGGGATDIRTIAGNWNDNTSLHSRLIVAGGGGGGSSNTAGGAGGGSEGQPGGSVSGSYYPCMYCYTPTNVTISDAGGTQTSGYAFGYGGQSMNYVNYLIYGSSQYGGGGGGGGGWYGGYGGTVEHEYLYMWGAGPTYGPIGGAGGSSYTGGVDNGYTQAGVHSGNGYALITKIDTLPNAPTITSPTTFTTSTPTITWNFNDVDQGDYQGYYQLVISNNNWASWYYDSDIIRSSDKSYTLPYLPNGTYQVAVRTWDELGLNTPPWGYGTFTVNADITPPTINTSLNPSSWTDGNVTIQLSASDSQSGVNYIKLPDGNIVWNDSANYTVNTNGDYTFYAYDKAGNMATKVVTVNNIDRTSPSLSLTESPTSWTNQDVTITAVAQDSQSGLKSIQLPNGVIITTSPTTYTVSTNGTYTFMAMDNLGHKTTQSITINNIDKISPTGTIVIVPKPKS